HINSYMNPYLDSVVKSSLADYDYSAGQQQAQDNLSLAGMDDTFGGSGGSLLRSMDNGQILRGRASLDSGLRSQGFNTALGAAQSDADRAQQARLADMTAKNTAWQFNAGQEDNNLNRQLEAAS